VHSGSAGDEYRRRRQVLIFRLPAYPYRRLPFTSLPMISRMMVRVSFAASLGASAASATLLTSFVVS
jgi:hypothetical protein